jgi:ABC-type proline/glycine betaine transport system substrate-binding protein
MFKWLAGFRKLAMAMIFLIVAVGLLLAGQIPNADWMKQMSTVMVAFMATNVGEHIINVAKDWVQHKKEQLSEKSSEDSKS